MVRPKARPLPRKDTKATVAFLSVAFGLLLLTAAYVWLLDPGHAPAGAQPIGGPFALEQDDGRVVTLRDFRGQYLLIYFGYVHCADVCPMTLSAVADALDILGSKAADLRPVFITVDPRRDTPAIARAYALKFSPRILGLGGTEDQVNAVEKSYRVSSTMMESAAGNPADYAMSHTAALFLMGPDGRFLAPLSGLQGGPVLAQQLAEYLPRKPASAATATP
jgi:protein SCO1